MELSILKKMFKSVYLHFDLKQARVILLHGKCDNICGFR